MTQQITDLIAENERLKTSLRLIKIYAKNAPDGPWRQMIGNMAKAGLNE